MRWYCLPVFFVILVFVLVCHVELICVTACRRHAVQLRKQLVSPSRFQFLVTAATETRRCAWTRAESEYSWHNRECLQNRTRVRWSYLSVCRWSVSGDSLLHMDGFSLGTDLVHPAILPSYQLLWLCGVLVAFGTLPCNPLRKFGTLTFFSGLIFSASFRNGEHPAFS